MKPKLILGGKSSGKTTRLLETVKWLKALIVCSTQQQALVLRKNMFKQKGYENVYAITVSEYSSAYGKQYDIVCFDEYDPRNHCVALETLLSMSKIQPVLTQSLDNEHFDIEII